MEPKKKTGTMRALILSVSAIAMLMTGVFVATTASATPPVSNGCPADFALAANGTQCYQLAQTQTTSTAPSCATGTLTPSGTHCFLPAVSTPQSTTNTVANVPTTTYTCPAGSTASGAGAATVCTQATSSTQAVAATSATTYSCPAGSTVAGGSGATLTCSQAGTTAGSVPAIATTTYTCPPNSTGAPTAANPTCATTTNNTVPPTCHPTNQIAVPGGCKNVGSASTIVPAGTTTCPAGTGNTIENVNIGGTMFLKCVQVVPPAFCAAGTYNTPVAGQCNVAGTGTVAAIATTTFSCPAGSTGTGTANCATSTPTTTAVAALASTAYSCPGGSTVAGGSGATLTCSQSVAGTTTVANIPATTYACPAGYTGAGAGAGLTCSQTVAAAPLITCKSGGSPVSTGAAGMDVCIVGPATIQTQTTPYCAKGVLSTDKSVCYLTVAAPASVKPAFTG